MSDLDSHDYTILSILQANAREKMENIAREIGLSVATVQRRIRALKDEGVIACEAAVLQPERVGFGMTFLVMVELERERAVEIDIFRTRVLDESQVQQCYYVTGDSDFILVVLTRDVESFKDLTQRLFFDNPNVKRFRTALVMDRTKISLNVPLDIMMPAEDAPDTHNCVSPLCSQDKDHPTEEGATKLATRRYTTVTS